MVDARSLDSGELARFVLAQRWFGAKSSDVVHAKVLDAPLARTTAPLLAAAVVEIGFDIGTHDLYQLPLGLRPATEALPGEAIGGLDGWSAYDALADPVLAREIVHLMRNDGTVQTDDVTVEFRGAPGLVGRGTELADVRAIESEQSNSSIVFDDELILKVYRRLEAGPNPELELLRFLTDQGFPNVPALAGWYAQAGRLIDATLGILQHYVHARSDGWDFALASLAGEPERFLDEVRRLGEVTGAMHAILASDPVDPAFAPEEPSTESLALVVATVDEEIAEVFASLPEEDALAPIAGRGEEVRDRLQLLSQPGPLGRLIRDHGDYHLGQVLWTGSDWMIVDFEGEPARSLPERRRKRSPLRDVAGMLRSFSYAASASSISRSIDAPLEWEERAREGFLDGYFAEVESTRILPAGQAGIERLIAVFELEKAVYELRYELDNRPDWVSIPVAAIDRLLQEPIPA